MASGPFSQELTDAERPSTLWAVPSLGTWAWAVWEKAAEKGAGEMRSSWLSDSVPVFAAFFGFPWWGTVAREANKPFPLPLVLISVLSQ